MLFILSSSRSHSPHLVLIDIHSQRFKAYRRILVVSRKSEEISYLKTCMALVETIWNMDLLVLPGEEDEKVYQLNPLCLM